MKISLNWIKDYVSLDGINPKELALKLTMSTAEVEEVIYKGNDVESVVVGKVTNIEPHPSSDKLKIVQVDTGGQTIQTVCGAPNVAKGILAPFAKIGGRILKVPRIEKTTLSGVESRGILCSGAEIGVNNDSGQLLILDETLKPGTDLKKLYGIDDVIVEIDNKSLTHRPDLWGHYGIAREVAAIFKRPLAQVERAELEPNDDLPYLKIAIEDKEKCSRYSGITVENVADNETPLDIQVRLYYCGLNPKSLLVDLSNYVMMDIGQPNHAFDNDYAQNIVVKCPPSPFKFRTLDDVERDIDTDVLMIYDRDTPVAVAGVIGGKDSEITGSTRSLFLESANFDAYIVRKGATKIGARTDAGTRFEKSLDPALTTLAIRRFMHILQTIQPEIQITSNLSDTFVRKPKPITIHLDKSYLDRCIGKELSTDTVIETLESLEFNVRHEDGDFTVRVPSFRATRDISLPVDLVEEVTRIYGYDNIEPRTVEVPIEPLNYNEERLLEHKVKETLAEKFGFSETHSYTWYDNEFNRHLGIEIPAEVKIVNPHAREMNVLRTSIVPVMLQFAQRNVNQFSTIPVFEIGKVYYNDKNPNECDERKNLCILSGDKDRGGDALFYQLKGIVTYLLKLFKSTEPQYRPLDESLTYPWLHPEKSVSIYAGERHLGYLTVVHPSVRRNIDKKLNIAVLELNFTDIYNIPEETRRYSGVSKYPEVSLDFSFLVDRDTHFKEVDDHIAAFKSELLIRYHYVVMYEGKNLPEGKKSLTFAFTIGSREKTLVTEDIDQFLNRLVEHMKTKGYTLR